MKRLENQEMITINGLHIFHYPLQVNKDVLGLEIMTVIAGIPVKICFPNQAKQLLKVFGPIPPLTAPKGSEKWQYSDKSIDWGLSLSSDGLACVNAIALFISCEIDKKDNYSQELYKAIENWENKLFDYLNLVCRKKDRQNKGMYCGLDLFENHHHIPAHIQCHLKLSVPNEKNCLSQGQIKEAISFASSNRVLRPEYEMLLSAFEAMKNNRNRQVVMDACAAVELTIIRKIREIVSAQGSDPEKVLKRVQMLGERFKKLRELDPGCPVDNIKNDITELRNALMHGKKMYPTNEETNRLVKAVEILVDHYTTDISMEVT